LRGFFGINPNQQVEHDQTDEDAEPAVQMLITLVQVPGNQKAASIESVEISRERLMAVMRSDHPLASYDRELSVADLASESLVMYARSIGGGLYQKIVDLYRDAGYSRTTVQEANATPTIMGLVAAGIGVSILPASLERLSFEAGQICIVARSEGSDRSIPRQALGCPHAGCAPWQSLPS
jgi:DNA-binding transcriptional LysR family regulator